jgi:type I restriction enzyme S subunit
MNLPSPAGRWAGGEGGLQGKPYLPADLWQLFPDRLDDEGKPEGWEKKRISEYLSLAYGKSLPAGNRHQGGVPVYGSGGITGFHSEALVNGPVAIVGRKGTVGSLYWEDRPCFPIDTVFYVQPTAPLPFCYYLLESLPLRDMNTDAAVPGLNRENVYRLEVAAPPAELIAAFAESASLLRHSIAAISRDSETLAQLRDTLLPKLISGELRIADAVRFLETRP